MPEDTQQLPELPDVGALIVKALRNSRQRPAPHEGLPDRSVAVEGHRQDAQRAASYARLCGFAVRTTVPATWLHVLTFPLQAQLMAQPDFPFALAGIVHVSNEITQHSPVSIDDILRLRVHAEALQPHKRGVTFDMVGEIFVGDELVWSGRSNYLAAKATLPGEPPQVAREPVPDAEISQVWRLPGDLGRQYARVSGDVNPIHLHPLTARLFGFPRPIIHGMWTHARALAAFDGHLPERYTVRVQFTKPIMLPSTVRFVVEDGARTRFGVLHQDSKPALLGHITAAP